MRHVVLSLDQFLLCQVLEPPGKRRLVRGHTSASLEPQSYPTGIGPPAARPADLRYDINDLLRWHGGEALRLRRHSSTTLQLAGSSVRHPRVPKRAERDALTLRCVAVGVYVAVGVVKIDIYFETMAGTHLGDALQALRDSGSADALFGPEIRAATADELTEDWLSIARDEAEGNRVSFCRKALLFAAFAAEAYANDFLYEKWSGTDQETLQRLSTVEKYVFLEKLAKEHPTFDRGREPMQRLKWLFTRRDELVHAVPKTDLTYHPKDHNPHDVAKSIVAVIDAAAALHGTVHHRSVLAYAVESRNRILAFGRKAAGDLPRFSAQPVPDLLKRARDRAWADLEEQP